MRRPAPARPGLALVLLLAGLLAGCDGTGPIFPASDALDPWVSDPASRDPLSDAAPLIEGQTLIFHLAPGQRRALLETGRRWGTHQTWLMGFDLRAAPSTLPLQPVTVSRLVRLGPAAPTELLGLTLDARNGLSFRGRSCVSAAALANWHRIELRYRFADDDAGFIELFCDRKPLWARQGLRTTLPPTCARSAGCTTPVPTPALFRWQLGLLADRRVARPVEIEMRQVFTHRLFYIPHRVGTL